MNRLIFLLVFFVIYFLLDYYVFVAIKHSYEDAAPIWRRFFTALYWSITALLIIGITLFIIIDPKEYLPLRTFLFAAFGILFFSKLFASLFVVIDDLRRGFTFLINLFPFIDDKFSVGRAKFISKTALIAGAIPITTMTFGIVSGAHDYRIRRRTIAFRSLPKAFDGIRIAQISDIHTGSFFNKTAVQGGVDLLVAEKPDLAFFTGDLVNNQSSEAKNYLDIFKQVKAPLGTYSVMGNHDYGDYYSWSSQAAKQKDIENLHAMHKYMGYDLLAESVIRSQGRRRGG
ncbi:MAG: metallophosphoesterase [Bacteroidota bacterium]